MEDWYRLSLSTIGKRLSVDTAVGLSKAEVVSRQKSGGLNELPRGKKKQWWQLLFGQFYNPLVFILLIAGGLTWWIDERIDTAVILLAVLVNVFIGFWQEFRSSKIFEELQKIVKVEALVFREGKNYTVDGEQLVPGDVILLRNGSKVPADCRIIAGRGLEINEALLTGESAPVKKDSADLTGEVPLADRINMAHMGTTVEKGEGKAIVVETGGRTELGKVAELTAGVEEEETPLQERLKGLGRVITGFVVVSAVLIIIVGVYEQQDFVEVFTVSVAVAVAAIPEGLPAALSVVLAVASQKILRKEGLVKTLIGAETLGSIQVICTDKTGTLTEGVMKVERVFEAEDINEATKALALANEAVVDEKGIAQGEGTDRAKLQYAIEHGSSMEALQKELPRCSLVPFSQEDNYIASFHRHGEHTVMYVSGSPEEIINRSNLAGEYSARLKKLIDEKASEGLRMIGLAKRDFQQSGAGMFDCENDDELSRFVNGLTFLGIAAIKDPVRSDVKESLGITREAGVRVIMMTGDHRLTAESVGRELGFNVEGGAVMEGYELDKLTDEELAERVEELEVLARVNPKHKMRVIDALQSKELAVAMTGDGVNDAPALRAADIGVSLGSGTDVTKEAADLVLLDNNFGTITAAIRQGRIAFDNIRKVTIFLLSNSFTELIIVLASLILKIPLPITAVQILWANLVEDGLPNFALAFEPGEEDIMRRKPVKRSDSILDREGFVIVYIVGIITDLILVGLFLYLYYFTHFSIEVIRTVIFATLATDSLLYVFSIKSLHNQLSHTHIFNNKYLLLAIVTGMTLMIISVYVPFFNKLLGTVPLHGELLVIVICMGIMEVIAVELTKWIFRLAGWIRT